MGREMRISTILGDSDGPFPREEEVTLAAIITRGLYGGMEQPLRRWIEVVQVRFAGDGRLDFIVVLTPPGIEHKVVMKACYRGLELVRTLSVGSETSRYGQVLLEVSEDEAASVIAGLFEGVRVALALALLELDSGRDEVQTLMENASALTLNRVDLSLGFTTEVGAKQALQIGDLDEETLAHLRVSSLEEAREAYQ